MGIYNFAMLKRTADKILGIVNQNYEEIGQEFSETRKHIWPEFKFFEKYFKKGAKVLDVGCGNGRLVEFLKNYSIDYTGLDQSKKLIEEAKKNFSNKNFVQGNILKLPFRDSSFDIIFCIAVLHHIPSVEYRKKAISEIKRVLKNKGIAIISTWNMYQPKFDKIRKKAALNSILTFGNKSKKDLFFYWGKEKKSLRYYYAFHAAEFSDLIEGNGLKRLEVFGTKRGERGGLKEAFNWWGVYENSN
ncbi:MAG: hypothetical protein UR27_C0004G0042 [Candidatus Peregrinibacteria bacterium GW2011_GWA2_33_10]|nr:MAG: hypothetical protein UR27_C0004G0042 [Candidatus Peregrinibacteria bacterium GW2011_GWA2_33_10]